MKGSDVTARRIGACTLRINGLRSKCNPIGFTAFSLGSFSNLVNTFLKNLGTISENTIGKLTKFSSRARQIQVLNIRQLLLSSNSMNGFQKIQAFAQGCVALQDNE